MATDTPDLVVGNDGQDRLYRNQEGGGFADLTHLSYPRDEMTTSAMAVGDVDGDGDPDLLLGSRDSRTRLYRNDGRLRFEDVTAAQVPPDGDYCNGVALGDVDLDGDLDAILANFGQSRIYVNDGSGTFAERPWLPSSYESVLSLATGDFDRDGDLDILLGTMAGEPCILLLNDGSGRYSDASAGRIPPNLSAVDGIAAGDVDGDGDLDAMLAGYDFYVGSRSVSLFENDGAGRFTDVTASLLPPISGLLKRPVLADLDLDGDLDAAIGGFLERILRNDGGRGFADVSEEALPLPSFGTSEFTVGDIDGDGDLDLALAAVNGLQDRILFNLHLQLSYLSVPRVGRRLEMELAGPPGGTWRLTACRDRVEIPMPPYGTLRVDPGTAVLRQAGRFSAEGKAVIRFLVPPAATLVGRSLYWQALIGPPQRLSNLEVTTFTNL